MKASETADTNPSKTAAFRPGSSCTTPEQVVRAKMHKATTFKYKTNE